MATSFTIRNELSSPSVEAFWEAYWSSEYHAKVDAEVGLRERELVEYEDRGDTIKRAVRLVPKRQLPGFLRKLTKADLGYTEHATYYRDENRMDIEIVPSSFADKAKILATYTVETIAPGRVARTLAGEITVAVPLVGKKIEQFVIKDLEKSYTLAALVMQQHIEDAARERSPEGG